MTTIVYDHKNKQIAYDSRETSGNVICSDNAIKYHKIGDELLFLCGDVPDIQEFVSVYPNIDKELCAFGVMVSNVGVHNVGVTKDGRLSKCKIEYSDAFGSGCEFALAAIDHGKAAKGAVEYAATRDTLTGGKVHVYDIEKGEFI